jgi:hypothetical protein
MRRDTKTDAADFFAFARDYLRTYMPTISSHADRKSSIPAGLVEHHDMDASRVIAA